MKPIRLVRITSAFLLSVSYFYYNAVHHTVSIAVDGQDVDSRNEYPNLPPLAELARSDLAIDTPCPIGTAPILDTISNHDDNDRRIPRIIHFTSKTRCVTIEFMENVNRWREKMPSHSIYFHDDEAVERLTSNPISQMIFPSLNETLKCVTNGITRSDLWRYLILYLYGGIYSDIDNSPSEKFNENTISSQDDFFTVLESLGIFAQYFIASSPGHPLMKLSLDAAMQRLRATPNVMNNNPAPNTGPGALKTAFVYFMNTKTDGYVLEGKYEGIAGRTVTVLGSKEKSHEYINRQGVDRIKKKNYYQTIGTKHFFDAFDLPHISMISCMEHLIRSNGTHNVANYTFDGSKYVDA